MKTDVVLDKQLNIRINAFDDDILLPISPDEIICNGGSVNRSTNHTDFYLQIGNIYDITYKKKGYEDTTLHINTQNSILLTHSELDVEMRPSKTKVALQFVCLLIKSTTCCPRSAERLKIESSDTPSSAA